MNFLGNFCKTASKKPLSILDVTIPIQEYVPLNLSKTNTALRDVDITDPNTCQIYIDAILQKNNAQVAYGGYLEKRNLYAQNTHFESTEIARNIHLGIDFWAKAGTKVHTPLAGKVHSFTNNASKGDYGPTIILEHSLKGDTFYTLYGHLSLASIENLDIGRIFGAGAFLATLGTPNINVNYAPHLHFQVIIDIGNHKGDYPGVCTVSDLDYYMRNCPDPNILLGM